MRRYSIKVDWWKLVFRLFLIATVGALMIVGSVLNNDVMRGASLGLCWGLLVGNKLEGKPIHVTREKPEAPND